MTVTILTTDRLILRSVDGADFDTLFDMTFSNAEVMQYAFEAKVLSKEDAMAFFLRDFDHQGCGTKIGVFVDKASGELVGFGGPVACSALGDVDYEVGFVLGREFWGKGYATEIGKAQIKHVTNTIGCKRAIALVSPNNTVSIAVLNKIGMTHYQTIDTPQRGKREVYAALAVDVKP